jgi:tetratricopeptide (TPR) repeat protein
MKKIISALFVLLCLQMSVNAQAPKQEVKRPVVRPSVVNRALVRYVNVWDTCANNTTRAKIYEGFDRLAAADTTNYYGQYYAAYIDAECGFLYFDTLRKQEVYTRALAFSDKAIKLSPKDAEPLILKAHILRLMANHNDSLETDHKSKIKKLIAEAKKMDATNPRLYLVEGDELLKAGNKKEAAKNYKLASDGLKANKSEEFLKPHWGTDEVKRSMAKTQ